MVLQPLADAGQRVVHASQHLHMPDITRRARPVNLRVSHVA